MRTGEKTSRLIFFWEVDETHTCPNKNYWTYTIDYSYIINHSHQLFVTIFQVYGFFEQDLHRKGDILGAYFYAPLIITTSVEEKT